jgi:uncharacterized iron-regulated protein
MRATLIGAACALALAFTPAVAAVFNPDAANEPQLPKVAAEPPPPPANPLAGKIYRLKDHAFVTVRELLADLAKAHFVLIGETHGRSAHQDREAFLLAALADQGRYLPVSFEMLTPARAAVVASYRATNPEYAMALGSDLEWDKSNWPSWSFYAPVFQVALTAKLPVFGAELDDSTPKPDGQTPPPEVVASWHQSLDVAHCGLADPARLQELTDLQWHRDQAMAKSLVDADAATGSAGAVLVAGSAHVRKDRGVARYLPPAASTAVALIEVGEATDAKTYLPKAIATGAVFDYIWFTPSTTTESTCDRLRKKGLLN